MEKNFYNQIISKKNLVEAYKKARKGKTQKSYVLEFEEDLGKNINQLNQELKQQIYSPRPLKTFVIREPKTRKISKAHFRDRVVHHALCNIIDSIFDKTFIYDNSANRKGKGSLFALKRFDLFKKKVTNNLSIEAYCLKADIKHYFQEVNHEILMKIIKKKITCEKTLNLIKIIIDNERANKFGVESNVDSLSLSLCNFESRAQILDNLKKGIPLGNLTSQFFANVYLNELDQFVKHKLKAKYYIRYVDDFVLLHFSKEQLRNWKEKIKIFLEENLKLELHPDKSKIYSLSKGIDFVGFRNFYYYRLLRKRNIRNIKRKINFFQEEKIPEEKFKEIWQDWSAYSDWSDNYNFKKRLNKMILDS